MAQVPWQVWAAGMVLCLLIAVGTALYYRCQLRKFCRVIGEFERGGTLEEGYADTMESKLLSQLKKLLQQQEYDRRKAGKEKEEIAVLLSDLSHQLKTPLSNILLNTDILKGGQLSPQEQKEFLMRNEEQAKKMQWLMKTLVKASRLEQGILVFDSFPAPLTETLARSISAVYSLAKERRITIETEDFPECRVWHNPKWTAEAIGNILENAVKYSPPGSCIRIAVQPLEMYVKVTVTDQGPGIREEEYSQIFRRFYRGTQTEQQEGTGLGLYLAQLILQSETGYITVSSQPGQGSCFSVFLLKEQFARKEDT